MIAVLILLLLWDRVFLWVVGKDASREFHKLAEEDTHGSYEFTNAEVVIRGPSSTSTCRWDHFTAAFESRYGMLLLDREGKRHWVEAGGFVTDDDRTGFAHLVRVRIETMFPSGPDHRAAKKGSKSLQEEL